jgi:death on curing protein
VNEPIWLDVEILIDLHAEQLALFGGPDGIRDQNMLEAALGRPIDKFTHGETDPAALAAAYGFDIARNHPSSTATNALPSARSLCF